MLLVMHVTGVLTKLNVCLQITVFKSRTDVAMLEAQDQVARLQEELVVARSKYDKVGSVIRTNTHNLHVHFEMMHILYMAFLARHANLCRVFRFLRTASCVRNGACGKACHDHGESHV